MGGREEYFRLIRCKAAVALLVKSTSIPFRIERLQVRLLYNSKDIFKLHLHFYPYDSVHKVPTHELLSKEIILKETKRFGWLRFNLSGKKEPF
jgi:hypothetical protein